MSMNDCLVIRRSIPGTLAGPLEPSGPGTVRWRLWRGFLGAIWDFIVGVWVVSEGEGEGVRVCERMRREQ